MITFDDFEKIEIRIGKVLTAEKIEKSEKLLKLQVDFGTEQRQILSGIAKWYTSKDLVGKNFPFIVNLEPRKMMGFESYGMLMAIDPGDDSAVLLLPDKEVPTGSIVK